MSECGSKDAKLCQSRDLVFIASITALSFSRYLAYLGFYSDDWSTLQTLVFSVDQSVSGLFRSFVLGNPDTIARPAQIVHYVLLYHAFGTHPTGYHIVNLAIFIVGLWLFYYVLLAVCRSRLLAAAVVLVYSQLPHYSTDRFWPAACMANASMALFFMGVAADVRAMSGSRRRLVWMWTPIASACLILSGLAYEVFMPLFLVSPFIAFGRWRRPADTPTHEAGSRLTTVMVRNAAIVAALVVFKHRESSRPSGFGFGWWLAGDAVKAAVDLPFGAYGLHLPGVLWAIVTRYRSWPALCVALAMVVSISFYLIHASRSERVDLPSGTTLAAVVLSGIAVCGLAYVNLYGYFRLDTGANNRVSIAAAVAVAFVVVGGIALLSRAIHSGATQEAAFAVIIAFACGAGFVINDTIASFWVEAGRRQQLILSEINQHFPAPPAGSTVMLTGFCPWFGPGIVFENNWDVTGALSILWRDNTIKGDVVRSSMRATTDGIVSGDDRIYPYRSLYTYDIRRREVRQVTDRKVALRSLAEQAQSDTGTCRADTNSFGRGQLIW